MIPNVVVSPESFLSILSEMIHLRSQVNELQTRNTELVGLYRKQLQQIAELEKNHGNRTSRKRAPSNSL